MKQYKIYTAGKMSGTSFEQQMRWRNKLQSLLKRPGSNVTFIHPPLYYNYEYKIHKTESEIKEWEFAQLYDSDVLVVNLDNIDSSTGSHFELGFANAINMFGNKHIFIIGIGDTNGLHPWIQNSLSRCEPDVESAAEYIQYYLTI